MHDDFVHLEQIFKSIAEYEAHFCTLTRYSTTKISTKFERIQKFVKELDGTYQL